MSDNVQNCSHGLVDVSVVIPTSVCDIKYATNDNFTGHVVYPSARCFLVHAAAHALKAATNDFQELGYRIKIWDCYRPQSAQYIFWQLMPDERYVADPSKGSRHNRGCSVDLTLVNADGIELDMGTHFDDFSEKAHRDCADLSDEVARNRQILQSIMEKHGFVGWLNEWWHFDYKDWQQYPLLNISFDEIEKA